MNESTVTNNNTECNMNELTVTNNNTECNMNESTVTNENNVRSGFMNKGNFMIMCLSLVMILFTTSCGENSTKQSETEVDKPTEDVQIDPSPEVVMTADPYDDTNAKIAGGVAAGGTVVAIGAGASTLSGAGIMSGLAAAGGGSAAAGIATVAVVPIVVGGVVYGIWRFATD